MNRLIYLKKIILLFYFFFYLIYPEYAISRNIKKSNLDELQDGLNRRDFKIINQYIDDEDQYKLNNEFSKIMKEIPNAKWVIKNLKTNDNKQNIIDVKINGTKLIDQEEFLFESNFNFLFSYINGKIKNSSIKNHLTVIRSDNNQVNLKIAIPNDVLTGANYDIDVIVNDPLEDEIIAGIIKEYKKDSIFDQKTILEPLAAGGIYKVTRAPSKPGIQIWTGIISHPKGLVTFTKTVNILENF